MALIKCPECKKEISDKASSCPICGFPLSEYLANAKNEKQRLEKEKQKDAEEKLRMKQKSLMQKRKVFSICGQKLSFDLNQKLGAIIGAEFEVRRESIHNKIQELLFVEDQLADLRENEFIRQLDHLIDILNVPLVDSAIYLCSKYADKIQKDQIVFDIQNAYVHNDIRSALVETYREAKNSYDLNCDNAHSQYYDDYYAAGTPAQPISDIYAKTLLGLAGANISAKFVNRVAADLTSGKIKKKEGKAKDKYYATVIQERIICNAKIYGVLDEWVDAYTDSYKEFVLEYLIEEGVLFEKHMFPLKPVEFSTYINVMSNEEMTNAEKKKMFYNYISSNPGDPWAYIIAIDNVEFDEADLKAILELIDYLDLGEVIKKSFEAKKHPAADLFKLGKDEYSKVYYKVTEGARTYGELVFATVEEKEKYIEEEKKYKEKLENIISVSNWYDYDVLFQKYDELEKLGTPEYAGWKKLYEETLKSVKTILEEIQNHEIRKIAPAVSLLSKGTKTIEVYAMLQAKQGLLDEISFCPELKNRIDENELLVTKVRWGGKILYITTRAFYCVETENRNILEKFTLNDVDEVAYSKGGITTTLYFNVYLYEKNRLEIFGANYPSEDIPALTGFAEKLKKLVAGNPEQIKRNLLQRCKNTESYKLTYSYVEEQLDFIAQCVYVISKINIYSKESKIGKFSFEITRQADPDMYKVISELKMGNEFIFYFDSYRIITDQAIYIAKRCYSFENAVKYEFETIDEIVRASKYKNFGNRIFVAQSGKIELVSAGSESGDFISILDCISNVLRFNGNYSSDLYQHDFLYCTECRNYMITDLSELKKCPKCSANLKKTGWYHRAFMGKDSIEIISKLKESDKLSIKEELEERVKVLEPYLHEDEVIESIKEVVEVNNQEQSSEKSLEGMKEIETLDVPRKENDDKANEENMQEQNNQKASSGTTKMETLEVPKKENKNNLRKDGKIPLIFNGFFLILLFVLSIFWSKLIIPVLILLVLRLLIYKNKRIITLFSVAVIIGGLLYFADGLRTGESITKLENIENEIQEVVDGNKTIKEIVNIKSKDSNVCDVEAENRTIIPGQTFVKVIWDLLDGQRKDIYLYMNLVPHEEYIDIIGFAESNYGVPYYEFDISVSDLKKVNGSVYENDEYCLTFSQGELFLENKNGEESYYTSYGGFELFESNTYIDDDGNTMIPIWGDSEPMFGEIVTLSRGCEWLYEEPLYLFVRDKQNIGKKVALTGRLRIDESLEKNEVWLEVSAGYRIEYLKVLINYEDYPKLDDILYDGKVIYVVGKYKGYDAQHDCISFELEGFIGSDWQ